ncbi:MAG: hypothetical protein ABIA93_00665 [Candidatus Woesearchaeota archaeon]
MRKIVQFGHHASYRLATRCEEFSLSEEEGVRRTIDAVQSGSITKKRHASMDGTTYTKYFQDNLSFYVVCSEKVRDAVTISFVKTVIIERGRC